MAGERGRREGGIERVMETTTQQESILEEVVENGCYDWKRALYREAGGFMLVVERIIIDPVTLNAHRLEPLRVKLFGFSEEEARRHLRERRLL